MNELGIVQGVGAGFLLAVIPKEIVDESFLYVVKCPVQ